MTENDTSVNNDLTLEEACYPMLVPAIPESENEFIERWKKFDLLPEDTKDILCSEQLNSSLQELVAQQALTITHASKISYILRLLIFHEISSLEASAKLISYGFPPEKTSTIINILLNIITNTHLKINTNKQLTIEQLLLNDAIKIYPEIGEQLITADKIRLKSFPEPVRPSLKNWLADYSFTVGFDNKDSIKRGGYLFHNENASKLATNDRQKLAYLLKSYDEKTPIAVNKDLKQIVFGSPSIERHSVSLNQNYQRTPSVSVDPQSSSAIHNTINYSSPQKLPYEKIQNPQPQQSPVNNNIVRLEPKPEPPRDLPRNVVNLRDNQ